MVAMQPDRSASQHAKCCHAESRQDVKKAANDDRKQSDLHTGWGVT